MVHINVFSPNIVRDHVISVIFPIFSILCVEWVPRDSHETRWCCSVHHRWNHDLNAFSCPFLNSCIWSTKALTITLTLSQGLFRCAKGVESLHPLCDWCLRSGAWMNVWWGVDPLPSGYVNSLLLKMVIEMTWVKTHENRLVDLSSLLCHKLPEGMPKPSILRRSPRKCDFLTQSPKAL